MNKLTPTHLQYPLFVYFKDFESTAIINQFKSNYEGIVWGKACVM